MKNANLNFDERLKTMVAGACATPVSGVPMGLSEAMRHGKPKTTKPRAE
jgi:hypothetical protein